MFAVLEWTDNGGTPTNYSPNHGAMGTRCFRKVLALSRGVDDTLNERPSAEDCSPTAYPMRLTSRPEA